MPELDQQEYLDRRETANDSAAAAARLVRDDMDEIAGPPWTLEPGHLGIDQARALMPWLYKWLEGKPVYAWQPASWKGGRWRRVEETFPITLPADWFADNAEGNAP